jgi:AcrR family transcriptional regulator
MAEKASIPAKIRGRPKSYDPDKALWQALEEFWAGGFAATSLDALSQSTGMNRPSLYAAFGDKKSLYLKTLARFTEELRKALGEQLFRHEHLADALMHFYGTAIELYLDGPDGPRGCFVVCTAPAEASNDPDIRAMLEDILKEIDAGLEARIRRAQDKGEVAADANPAALARLAAATLHSIAIRARAGEPKKALLSLASQAARLIAPAQN